MRLIQNVPTINGEPAYNDYGNGYRIYFCEMGLGPTFEGKALGRVQGYKSLAAAEAVLRDHRAAAVNAEKLLAYHNGLADLRRYVMLPKFSCGNDLDGYVSVQDVLNRIADIESAVTAAS